MPEYYEKWGCTIISFAVDLSMYLVHNSRPTGGFRLTYSEVEELSTLTTAKHTLVRQAALDYGIDKPCTLSIISDVPKGTGLGSSSALAVALAQMFSPRKVEHQTGLAKAAYELERKVSPVGIQDHLAASWGGFRVYHIQQNGKVDASRVRLFDFEQMMEQYGVLFYTGLMRDANPILKTWSRSENKLHQIKDLADSAEQELKTLTPKRLGELLHVTWTMKKKIGGVSNPELSAQYDKAIGLGAIGGKLLGAGGGGCWFFLVPPQKRKELIDGLGLTCIPFGINGVGAVETYV